MSSKTECIVALGANQGTENLGPLALLEASVEAMKDEFDDVTAVSAWYETPAFPEGSGPNYINGVARILSQFSAVQTLDKLHAIEFKLGRTRQKRWESRVCDLDLISFGDAILPEIETYRYWRSLPLSEQMQKAPETVILPHPRVHERAFVLVPLLEVAPDWVHPVTGEDIGQLVADIPEEELRAVKPLNG